MTATVLTGDIVNSRGSSQTHVAQAIESLRASAESQRHWYSSPLRFSRHRGDGWQVILSNPSRALRSALAFRASLKATGLGLDTYIAMADGEVPAKLLDDLNAHTEDVFVRSGTVLDDLKTSDFCRMAHDSVGAYDAATILADRISQKWTAAQARAIQPVLVPDTHWTLTELAKSFGISRQAVSKSLDGAGRDHIELALETLERDS